MHRFHLFPSFSSYIFSFIFRNGLLLASLFFSSSFCISINKFLVFFYSGKSLSKCHCVFCIQIPFSLGDYLFLVLYHLFFLTRIHYFPFRQCMPTHIHTCTHRYTHTQIHTHTLPHTQMFSDVCVCVGGVCLSIW